MVCRLSYQSWTIASLSAKRTRERNEQQISLCFAFIFPLPKIKTKFTFNLFSSLYVRFVLCQRKNPLNNCWNCTKQYEFTKMLRYTKFSTIKWFWTENKMKVVQIKFQSQPIPRCIKKWIFRFCHSTKETEVDFFSLSIVSCYINLKTHDTFGEKWKEK